MEDVEANNHIAPESVNSEEKGNSSLILIKRTVYAPHLQSRLTLLM